MLGPDRPEAPTAVLVHGFLVSGTLWNPVAELLAAAGIRSIVPDWPLGAHRTPIPDDRELSPTTVAVAITDLLAALDLDRHFTVDPGRRLAATFPRADLTEIPDATTFVPVDRADAVADAIALTATGQPRPAPDQSPTAPSGASMGSAGVKPKTRP